MGSKGRSDVRRGRLASWLTLGAVVLAAGLSFTLAPMAVAQDDPNKVQEAPPAAPPPPAATTPAPGGTEPAAAPTNTESQLVFFYRALGLKYVVIFLVISFIFVALLVMNFLTLRRESIVPTGLVEGFEAHLNEKRYQDAYELAKNDDSFLGHVLSAGLGKLQSGYAQAIEAMQEVGEEESMRLEQRLSYIAMVGTVAPMFGLLGTVDGMVQSFQVIASSDTQPKPSQLAEGISMALITTLVGLWLAIPAIIAFGIMRNRMSRLILEAGIMSEGLMSRFSTVGKKA
jgi:biopolymer transport protein ExbB